MSDVDTTTIVAGAVALTGVAALLWVVLTPGRSDGVPAEQPDDAPPAPPVSEATPLPEQPVPPAPQVTMADPAPSPPAPPSPPPAPATPHVASSSARYLTAPGDIGEPVWMPLGTDKEIAVLIPDLHTGGYAHGSTASSLALAAKYGASLPTHDDMVVLANQAKAAGFELDPVILPGASPQLLSEGAKPGDARMSTEEWVRTSDDLIRQQLKARNWDGKTAVANVGKVWLAGAPAGRGYLMGWRQKNGVWIQQGVESGNGPHDDSWCDFSMYVTLVRPAANA